MIKRREIRFIIGLFSLAAIFYIIQWIREVRIDPDFGSVSSREWIALLEEHPSGARIMVIQPDGKVIRSLSKKLGIRKKFTDRDFCWRPDGGRLFMISNRERSAFDIYRWNLLNHQINRRTFNTRPKLNINCINLNQPPYSPLFASGAEILELDLQKGSTHQILPPLQAVSSGAPEALSHVISAYKKLGKSFIKAIWSKSQQEIYALMKREDGLQILFCQELNSSPAQNGALGLKPPFILAIAEKIDFDVSSEDKVVYSLMGKRILEISEYLTEPDSKLILNQSTDLYTSLHLVKRNLAGEFLLQTLIEVPSSRFSFSSPQISPDGKAVLYTALDPEPMEKKATEIDSLSKKRFESVFNIKKNSCWLCLTSLDGSLFPSRFCEKVLKKGRIFDPSWSSSGDSILYIQENSGSYNLMKMDFRSRKIKRLYSSKNRLSSPKESPFTGE